jgi:hypothetical protein
MINLDSIVWDLSFVTIWIALDYSYYTSNPGVRMGISRGLVTVLCAAALASCDAEVTSSEVAAVKASIAGETSRISPV